MKDLSNMSKQEIINEIVEPKESRVSKIINSSRFNRKIKLKFNPFVDVPTGKRRCGQCGKLFNLKEFMKGKLGEGYHYHCKDCRKYLRVLQ